MSLYLKYRPQKFAYLVGQDHIKITLQNALKKSQVNHAYLFCGPRGTGKTSAARLIAKAINCPQFDVKNLEPCDECEICSAINEGKLIDVIEIDAASNRGIDEIRELKETIKFAPTQVKNKVYIIDEVHMLTTEAFNALLKTLEEPPSNVFFVLATTEVHKIPDTIISRCQRFDFRRMTDKTIEARLAFIAQAENISVEVGVLEMISGQVNGGLRDAIGLLEQLNIDGKVTLENAKNLIGSTGTDIVASFYESIVAKEEAKALSLIGNLHAGGHDMGQFRKDFTLYLRSQLLNAIETENSETQNKIVGLIETWQNVMDTFNLSIIPQLPIEVFIVKSCTGAEKVKQVPVREAELTEDVIIPVEESVELDLNDEENTNSNEIAVEPKSETINSKDNIEEEWVRVISGINKSTLKRSLQQSILRFKEKDVYEIVLNSDFHFKTVNTAENLSLAEHTIKDVLNKSIALHAVKEDIKITPAKIDPDEDNSEETSDASEKDIVMEAMDMFEGEFID